MMQGLATGALFTPPSGGEVGVQRRMRGPFTSAILGNGSLIRPKRVGLSPKGEVKRSAP